MQGFGKLRRLRKETRRIQARIDEAFEVIEPEIEHDSGYQRAVRVRGRGCRRRPVLRRQARAAIPVIVLGEFRYGIAQSKHRSAYEAWLDSQLPDFDSSR